MYCIAGLLHPVHGEICFGNEAMNQLDERGKEKKFVPPQERNIAMVFQEYALYPNMTVRKNMSFALETKKAPKEEIEKRVNSMSAMLGLDELLDRKPAQLSGGQRQALTLLMAALQQPKLLLLDEHTAALDPRTAAKVLDLSDRIVQEHGLTTLMITHNMKDAIAHGNRLIMMDAGQVVVDVSGEEKKKLTVPDLLAMFSRASGSDEANDKMLLS